MKARLQSNPCWKNAIYTTMVAYPVLALCQSRTGIKTFALDFTKGHGRRHVWFYEHPIPKVSRVTTETKPMRFENIRDGNRQLVGE